MAQQENKTMLRFSVFELDRIVVSMLENIVNNKYMQNIRTLFYQFDPSSYINDEEKLVRVYLIRKLAEIILADSIQTKEVLLNTISFDGKYANKCIEILNNLYDQTISEKEAVGLDKKISQLLRFSVIEQQSNILIQNINNIKSENYEDLEKELDSVEDEILRIQKGLKDYHSAIDEANNQVSFDSPAFLGRLNHVIERAKNPSSTIRTGIKLFNEILGGGFKAGRVYCCMAPMKNFKSGLLLNSCLWAKKYNNIKAKDPTKRPIVLYITLENSINETIERVCSYCEGNNFKIADHDSTDVAKILEAHGVYSPNNATEISLEMIYRPNKSITVADIGLILDEYLKDGKEVVFLAVDYLKRIRPSVSMKDLRIDLGNIADDFHVLATERDIPIFTAMQLNRSAIAEMDSAENFEQKLAAFGRIGASNVGESIDIPQNVDLCFTMVKTVDPKINEKGELESIDKFINIRVVASRYNIGDVDSFIHRFKPNNDMCLDEDCDAAISRSIINKQVLLKDRVIENGIKTRGPRHV